MNDQKQYALTGLSEQELNVMLTGLSQLPYAQVWQLIAKMQEQFSLQNQEQIKD